MGWNDLEHEVEVAFNAAAAIEGGEEIEHLGLIHLASLLLLGGKERQQLLVHHLFPLVDL